MMVGYASDIGDVDLVVVNTSPRWRAIQSNGFLLRVVGGGFQLLRDIFRLCRVLNKKRYDAVHLTTSGQVSAVRDIVVSYLTRFFGIRLVYHVRFGRIPAISQENTLEWRIILRVMHRASTVILIDKATFSAVQRFAPDAKAVLIPNCVNFAELPAPVGISSDVKTALFVGWVIPTKGITELVEAWSILRPPGWRLEIVGPGDTNYQAELLRKFEPVNLEFIGELSHAQAKTRMSNCDLFVLPSYTEGFPNAVLEAMALGRAILTTAVGAIPEMLADDCGLMVEPRNVSSLTAALEALCSNPDLRLAMGRRAREHALANYSIEIVFEKADSSTKCNKDQPVEVAEDVWHHGCFNRQVEVAQCTNTSAEKNDTPPDRFQVASSYWQHWHHTAAIFNSFCAGHTWRRIRRPNRSRCIFFVQPNGCRAVFVVPESPDQLLQCSIQPPCFG